MVILVAEDNRELREAMVEHLRTQGLEVHGVADGRQALEVIEQHGTSITALMTDFDMPRLDGIGLIALALKRVPNLRVLLVTSRLPAELPEVDHPVDVLRKPFALDELSSWLTAGADGRLAGWTLLPDRGERRSEVGRVSSWVAVAAVAGLVLALWGLHRAEDDALPVPPTEDVVRSISISRLEPIGVMEDVPEKWTWRAVPDAVRYRVVISDILDQELWQGDAQHAQWKIPLEIRAQWPSNVALYLKVEALDADGAVLASIQGQRIRVVPRPPTQAPQPTAREERP